MIRNNHLIGPYITTHQRTYTREEWNANRMQYIEEARTLARETRPSKVLLRVKDSPKGYAKIEVTIRAH